MFRCRTAVGLALLLFFFSSVAARAQFGVYGTVTGERFGGFQCLVSTGCAASNGVAKPYGAAFGGYYDFRSVGPVRLGVDVRGSVLNSNKSVVTNNSSIDFVRHYSALGGLRAEFHTPFKWLHPYGQISAGLGRSNAAFVDNNPELFQNFTQVEGFAGADITILPVLDLRAIELGAGEAFGPSSHSIQSIGIGVVFHTPR
jgi:hypothetical protein